MGTDNWNHSKFLHHKARNATRRGYLQKTYYDKKLMQSRFATGEKNQNDRIDIIQPAGFLGRHPPGEKTEIVTSDIGGDTSRRVCTAVIGDREHHPKIDEAESILYSPGDKLNYMRIKGEKPKQEGQGKHGSGAEFEDPYDGDGNEDKNPKGIHIASETNETHKIKETFQVEAEKDIRIKAPKIYIKGVIHLDGTIIAKAGLKVGNGMWGDQKPDDYPGAVPTTREPPAPEAEPGPVVESSAPRPYLVDAEGNVTFLGTVTFKGPVQFDSPVTFEDVVTFALGEDNG
jgi:phage baseplate assembly protein gpV